MIKGEDMELKPDYAVIPGKTVRDSLEVLRMSQTELARRMSRPLKTINEIIKGKAAITADTAIQLEKVLGPSATFWNNLERQYRETIARIKSDEELRGQEQYARRYPYKELAKDGFVEDTNDVVERIRQLQRFFGVGNLGAIRSVAPGAFRRSPTMSASPEALASWLRIGELKASRMHLGSYEPGKFKTALGIIRGCTTQVPAEFQPRMESLCAASGVAVVIHHQLSKTYAHGATKWLGPERALVQLSIRYGYADIFWFSFFHEAAHILLHSKRLDFIEGTMKKDEKEREADRYAAECLIPSREYRAYLLGLDFSDQAIHNFATKLGIDPGIIVGRLQHDGHIKYSELNYMRTKFVWAKA